MSNELVTLPDAPAYLATLLAEFPDLANANQDALQGLSVAQPPSIALNGTRFVVKENGEEHTLNKLELTAVILKAKPNFDKAWYAVKFKPGQEPAAPDCASSNGVTPDSGENRQATSCAGCPKNQFGTGTDNEGNITKGKACGDTRTLAIFCNGGIYKFKIPAMSLKAFGTYIKSLESRSIFMPTIKTIIGFDPNFSFPVLTFSPGGMLSEQEARVILAKRASQEVADIIGGDAPKQIAAPAPVKQVAAPAPVVEVEPEEDIFAAEPTAPAKAAPKPKAKVAPIKPVVEASDAPSDADLAAALGLDL